MIYYKALNAEGSKSDLESSTASKILTRCVVQGGRAGCVCILIMYHSRLPLTRCRLHDTIWTKDNDNRTNSLPHYTFFSFSFLTLVLYDGWCFSGLQSSVSRQAYCDFVETIHYGDTEAGQSRVAILLKKILLHVEVIKCASDNFYCGFRRVKLPGSECFNLLELSL